MEYNIILSQVLFFLSTDIGYLIFKVFFMKRIKLCKARKNFRKRFAYLNLF